MLEQTHIDRRSFHTVSQYVQSLLLEVAAAANGKCAIPGRSTSTVWPEHSHLIDVGCKELTAIFSGSRRRGQLLRAAKQDSHSPLILARVLGTQMIIKLLLRPRKVFEH